MLSKNCQYSSVIITTLPSLYMLPGGGAIYIQTDVRIFRATRTGNGMRIKNVFLSVFFKCLRMPSEIVLNLEIRRTFNSSLLRWFLPAVTAESAGPLMSLGLLVSFRPNSFV